MNPREAFRDSQRGSAVSDFIFSVTADPHPSTLEDEGKLTSDLRLQQQGGGLCGAAAESGKMDAEEKEAVNS